MATSEKYFRTIYYSDFWYSRHYRLGVHEFGGNIVHNEISQHHIRLRLLSIFFDEIYLPRTHLITQAFDDQYHIADQIIDSRELNYLLERDSIRVSSFPGLDAAEDSERILSRQSKTDAISYPQDPKYIRKIPITREFLVDTKLESASNAMSFPAYGNVLKSLDAKMADRYLDIVKQSQIEDIPFFHEKFVRMLREQFPDELFDPVWRNTNSIYLTSGALEHESFIAYFNEELESPRFRFEPHGIDRYLLSPASLYTFLGIFLDTEAVSRLLFGKVDKTHAPIFSDDMRGIVALFREEFQQIAWRLSRVVRSQGLENQLDQRVIRRLFELGLDDGLGKASAMVNEAAADAEKAAELIGNGAGFLMSVLRAGAKYSTRAASSFRRRRRYPGIYRVMDQLEKATKEER